MGKDRILEEIGRHRVSATIRSHNAALASSAMKAAVEGGFRMVEFTLTTPEALRLIGEFAADARLLVGAGTVLTPQMARDAVRAGARFLVSPVTDPAVIQEAGKLEVPCIPGTFTPSEMLAAHNHGADLIKIFPAPADLPRFVSQIRGPLPFLKLFPTAGVDEENFIELLREGVFAVAFVSSLFRPEELAAGNFRAVRDRAEGILRKLEAAGLTGEP